MKFRAAVILSVVLHISLVAVAVYAPSLKGFGSKETIYYVDFIQMPGGGGGGSGGGSEGTQAALVEDSAEKAEIKDGAQSVKDLTVKKETGSKLRYPDQDKKKQKDKAKDKKPKTRKKKEKQELVSVVRKDRRQFSRGQDSSRGAAGSGSSNIRIGTGVGTGSGSGSGSGGGFGGGSGSGSGFPYAYYIDTIKNKISSSWYNALVSPGLRGTLVVTVYFKILRNGQLKELEIERESGSKSLDLSALRAVENAAPFPPLPGSFPYSYLGVHFEFEWKK